jgi:CRISPR/Cas system-associated exonuclease Cas4 (RecB family)
MSEEGDLGEQWRDFIHSHGSHGLRLYGEQMADRLSEEERVVIEAAARDIAASERKISENWALAEAATSHLLDSVHQYYLTVLRETVEAVAESVPTFDEIKRWPATVDPAVAGRAFGISRSHSYDLIKVGAFPAKVIKCGNRHRVVTASIVAALEATS